MRVNVKLLCVLACTTLALFAGGATASRSLEMSVAGGELENIAAESEAMSVSAEGGLRITCKIKRSIAVHRQISKAAGTLAGRVIRFDFSRECTGGEIIFTVVHSPRHITYVSFAGSLPSITGLRLRIIRFGFQITTFAGFVRCEYEGDVELTTGGIPISEFRYDESRSVPLVSGSGGCPSSARLSGRLRLTPNIRMGLV